VKINHNDGDAPTTLEFVYSHPPRSSPEVEVSGVLADVDAICTTFAAQIASTGHFEHRFRKKVHEIVSKIQREFEGKLNMVKEQNELQIEKLKLEHQKQLDALTEEFKAFAQPRPRKKSKKEGSADVPDYFG
jgi:hypothetical protein